MKQWAPVCAAVLCFTSSASKLRTSSSSGAASNATAESNASANPGTCANFDCPESWVMKIFHFKPTERPTTALCCVQTCRAWNCAPGYVSSPEYANNVLNWEGYGDQVCCDKQCGRWDCDAGFGQNDTFIEKAGKTHEECCFPLCKSYTCPESWTPIPGKKSRVANTTGECCQKQCVLWDCTEGSGWVKDNRTDEITIEFGGKADEQCCQKTCFLHDCPAHFSGVLAKNFSLASDEECCAPLCSGFICSGSWAPDRSKVREFGNSSQECCLPTCKQHDCHAYDYWLDNPAKDGVPIPIDVSLQNPTCCLPACRRVHTCSDGWIANDSAAEMLGKTDDVCCMRSCRLYECPKGMLKREEAENDTASENACCEETTTTTSTATKTTTTTSTNTNTTTTQTTTTTTITITNTTTTTTTETTTTTTTKSTTTMTSTTTTTSTETNTTTTSTTTTSTTTSTTTLVCTNFTCDSASLHLRPEAASIAASDDSHSHCCELKECDFLRTAKNKTSASMGGCEARPQTDCEDYYFYNVVDNESIAVRCEWSRAGGVRACRTAENAVRGCSPM